MLKIVTLMFLFISVPCLALDEDGFKVSQEEKYSGEKITRWNKNGYEISLHSSYENEGTHPAYYEIEYKYLIAKYNLYFSHVLKFYPANEHSAIPAFQLEIWPGHERFVEISTVLKSLGFKSHLGTTLGFHEIFFPDQEADQYNTELLTKVLNVWPDSMVRFSAASFRSQYNLALLGAILKDVFIRDLNFPKDVIIKFLKESGLET